MSRFVMLVGVLVATMAAWPAGQVAAPPVPGQAAGQPPVTGTGFIAGQVVDSVSGRPVPSATVMMTGAVTPGRRGGAGATNIITADEQGRFFFRNLVAALYTITATKPGYATTRPGLFDVGDAERVVDARVRVSKLAAVSGYLRDGAGDPVVGTEVLAFQQSFTSGRAQLQPVMRGVKSDDRGMYRLPGLSPGTYLICACLRDPIPFDQLLLTTLASEPFNLMSLAARALTSGSDVVAVDDTLRGFAPTFYPASRTMAEATKVTVAAGEDKTGVDITAELVRATRVSGRIVGAQSPLQASSARLVPQADADAGIQLTAFQPMLMQPDGRFDFANVPPGQYRLIVTHRETGALGGGPSGLALNFTGGRAAGPPPPPIAIGGPGVVPPPVLWANETITVGDRGLTGLAVSLTEGLAVSGRVMFVGSAPQPTEQVLQRSSVALQLPAAVGGNVIYGPSSVATNGTFRSVGHVPGRYLVSFTGVPGYTNLKSATLAGVDVTDLPFEIGLKEPGELVLTFVDTPASSVTVTVPPQAGRRSDEDVVLLFPADRKYWPDPLAGRRRFHMQQVSSKGVATIAGLPAGDYFILIDPNVTTPDWQQTTLDELSRRAQRVTLGDGEKRSIEVRR